MTGAILLILGTAAAAAWTLTQTGFAQYLAGVMQGLPGGWVVYMAVTVAVSSRSWTQVWCRWHSRA